MYIHKPLELVFSFTSLSYIQQKIFNVLVWFAFNESRSSPFNSEHFIKIPLIKNKIHTNANDTNDFYIRSAILSIIDNTHLYNLLSTDNSSKHTLDKSLFLSVSIDHNIVKYSLDEDFLVYFQNDTRYISLSLKVLILLKSKYSLKLYEIMQAMLSHDISLFSLDVFKKMMGVHDGYHNIAGFKTRVLDVAQAEIYQHTNIIISYYMDKKQNNILLYPQSKEKTQESIDYINTVFLDATLLYKSIKCIYKNIYLDEASLSFYLIVIDISSNEEYKITKNSLQELKLFVQKHITIY